MLRENEKLTGIRFFWFFRVLAEDLNGLFDRVVDVERIKHGKRQTIDALISEEAFLLAKYLRRERNVWTPRLPSL
jgi:hypothetical protein